MAKKEVAPGVFVDEETTKNIKVDGKHPKRERFSRLKSKLRGWLFPEYDRVCTFMNELDVAREVVVKVGGKVTFKEPVVFVGSLNNCAIDIRPTLRPEIVLARLAMESALSINGSHHTVLNSLFRGFEESQGINLGQAVAETSGKKQKRPNTRR